MLTVSNHACARMAERVVSPLDVLEAVRRGRALPDPRRTVYLLGRLIVVVEAGWLVTVKWRRPNPAREGAR